MNIEILVTLSFGSAEEVEKTIDIVNETQSFFKLRLGNADWVEKHIILDNDIDYDKVCEDKRKVFGDSPVIVITKDPLKDDLLAYYDQCFYIMSLGDWETNHLYPPVRVLLVYYVAGICCSFSCDMPEAGHDEMYHSRRPIGCISDLCPKGNSDILLSMENAKICSKCTDIYKKYGCDEQALNAAGKLLEYVKDETIKYTSAIPYDLFISYNHNDKDFVRKLVKDLEKHRLKIWRDEPVGLPGQMIAEEIINGILNSKCLLCVLSPRSVQSGWVRRELAIAVQKAQEKGKDEMLVIPALIENCSIPNILYGVRYLSFQQDGYNSALNKILQSIRAHISKTSLETEVDIPEGISTLISNQIVFRREAIVPFWFDQRQQDLSDLIAKDFKMLNEYRNLLRGEHDPSLRDQYKIAIERLKESAAEYQRDYNDLMATMRAQPSAAVAAASDELQNINSKLDMLAIGIKEVLEGQDDLRQELLAKYGSAQQNLIAAIIKRLDQSQIEIVNAVLDEVESNRLSEVEMRQLVECTQHSLAQLQQGGNTFPEQAEIDGTFIEQMILKDKLKLAIPLIPSILEYELEMEFDEGASLREIWQQLKARFRR